MKYEVYLYSKNSLGLETLQNYFQSSLPLHCGHAETNLGQLQECKVHQYFLGCKHTHTWMEMTANHLPLARAGLTILTILTTALYLGFIT